MGTGGHNVPLIIDDYGFRKLTPRECFSFQGFPKSYKIPNDMDVILCGPGLEDNDWSYKVYEKAISNNFFWILIN